MFRPYILLILISLLGTRAVFAHEFWIEPQNYQVESGDKVVADLKNGQNFNGISLAWFDHRFTRFESVMGNTAQPVVSRTGDTPAATLPASQDGLMIILHETVPSTLIYRAWEEFEKFARHKDFPNAETDHTAAGWPKKKFRESYTRHAKALVAVGSGAGADRAFGLATEFIALTNPYAAGFADEMTLRLEYDGIERPNAQVEVFEKTPLGEVEITLHRTDTNGIVRFEVKPGHQYLVDAVVLRPADQAGETEQAPVWETLWAALTFAVPG